MNIKPRIINALGYVILVALLVLSCGLGAYAAYMAMFTALLGLFVAFDLQTLRHLLCERWLQMWLGAFALLAIAFAVSAQTTKDMLYAFDFSEILLALAVAMIFSKLPSGKGVQTIALLSFVGTLSALAIALYSVNILQLPRATGLEMSTIHFAYFSVILGFLSLSGFFLDGGAGRKIYLLGPPIGLLAAALTGTRGAILVLGACLLVLLVFFLLFVKLSSPKKWLSIASVPLLAIGIGLVSYALGFSRAFASLVGVAQAFAGYQDADTSASFRFEHMSAGIKAFMDAPWFGHGWANQITSALSYMSRFAHEGFVAENWAYLHNELLSLAVSAGVLGIVAFVLIYTAPLIGLQRSARDTQFVARSYGLFIIIGGFLAGGLTEVLFKYELPKTFLFFMIPIFLIYCRDIPAHEVETGS